MLRIQQFRYSADNFAYVIYGDTAAGVVDGGAVEKILTFLADTRLTLQFIANTHQHADHTVGTGRLRDRTGAAVFDSQALRRRNGLEAGAYGGFTLFLFWKCADQRRHAF